jgi:hypothetical protein
VWAFNFFFYNKKMKRILYLAVKAVSKAAADEDKVRCSHKFMLLVSSRKQGARDRR